MIKMLDVSCPRVPRTQIAENTEKPHVVQRALKFSGLRSTEVKDNTKK